VVSPVAMRRGASREACNVDAEPFDATDGGAAVPGFAVASGSSRRPSPSPYDDNEEHEHEHEAGNDGQSAPQLTLSMALKLSQVVRAPGSEGAEKGATAAAFAAPPLTVHPQLTRLITHDDL
jgi:hypothetical protein